MSELWTCPDCGNTFVSKNMWHSCGQYSLEALFSKSEPQVLALGQQFIQLVQATCGEVTVIPQRTRVTIQALVRFTACMPRKSFLLCHFWLSRRHEHPRFWKIETVSHKAFIHYVRVREPADFDNDFVNWILEAYVVGERKHLA